jgi:hypothetical protein
LKNVALIGVQHSTVKEPSEGINEIFKLRQAILRFNFAKPVVIDHNNEIFKKYSVDNSKYLQFVLLNSSGELISKFNSLNHLKSQIIKGIQNHI